MKYETVKAGSLIQYLDEAEVSTDKWEALPNHMVGLQVCGIRVRRPVAEDFTVPNYAKACEGDRIGPFSQSIEADRFAFQIAKTHSTHKEWDAKGIYLVVNRKYERGE